MEETQSRKIKRLSILADKNEMDKTEKIFKHPEHKLAHTTLTQTTSSLGYTYLYSEVYFTNDYNYNDST